MAEIKKELVSVITVCYNAEKKLEETMLSVLNQTYSNIEYIIIDGGSGDGTVDIIKKYADRLAYWVSESDSGIYDAMNKGILKATGKFLIFMNAGDQFFNEKVLDKCLPYFLQEIDIISGIGYLSGQKWIPAKVTDLSVAFFLKKSLNHQATFINRKLFQKNLYRTNLKIAGDSIFFFQALIMNNASYVDIPVEIALCEKPGLSGQEKESFAELEISIKEILPNRMVSDVDFLIKYYNPAVRMIGGWLYKMHFLKRILRFIRTNRRTR
jgi:hypothetical protein BACCOPRO_01716